jgi:hypothetical protein
MPALEAAQARQFLLERSTFDIRLMYRQKSARTRVISQHVRHDLPGDQIEDSDVIHSERLQHSSLDSVRFSVADLLDDLARGSNDSAASPHAVKHIIDFAWRS